MSRMFAPVLLFLAVLALLSPGKAFAGPPEGVSGKMVLDKVADGLRQCRRAKTAGQRIALLKRLAPSQDPRVAIAIAEELVGDASFTGGPHRQAAAYLLMEHYIPKDQWTYDVKYSVAADRWWEKNEADLRRRANLLPELLFSDTP